MSVFPAVDRLGGHPQALGQFALREAQFMADGTEKGGNVV